MNNKIKKMNIKKIQMKNNCNLKKKKKDVSNLLV